MCLKPRIITAALALTLHVFVLAALTVRSSPEVQPVSLHAPVFEVTFSLAQRVDTDNPQSANVDAMPMPVQGEKAPKESEETTGEVLESEAELINSAPEPAWEDWLPQLSKTPLPLLENLPLIGQSSYLHAGELDVRPSPEAPIIIPFPDASLHKQKGTAILLLYIAANGTVERVEIDESALPMEFEQAAIDTFMHAKMRPGIKDGKPVPVRMKIEVEFEAK